MPPKKNKSTTDVLYIHRKLYFYIIRFKSKGKYLDPSVVVKHIDSLPFSDVGRYQKLDDTKGLSMHIDSSITPLKIRLGTRRLGDLPTQENQGNIYPMALPRNYALFEPAHFMIYVDDIKFENNVIAFEFNFYGPRIGKLRSYILEKASSIVDDIELCPLINKDFEEKIKRMGEIKRFEIGIQRNNGELLKVLDESLPDALNGISKLSDSEFIELVYRPKKNSKKPIKVQVIRNIEKVRKFFNQPGVADNVDNFRVKAENKYSDEIEIFDFLEEYLVSKRSVIKADEKHKSVDMESMYNSMDEAYKELSNEIHNIIKKE